MGISSRIFGTSTRTHGDQDRRTRSKVSLTCDSLEGRRLLTTISPSATAVLSSAPAAAVATATSILQAKAPQAFQAFASDLAQAESSSRITPAQYDAIATMESALDNAINSSGLATSVAATKVSLLQDQIDGAFLGNVNRASVVANLQGTSASLQFINKTVADMQSIARSAHISPQVHSALVRHEAAIRSALGATPDTDLGPGASDRDPLAVYVDAQVSNFVR
jgi:hypothetical protein